MRSRRFLRRSVLLTASASALVVALLVSVLVSLSNPVRIRNSLIMRLGSPSDFDWAPDSRPATFRLESGPIPPSFSGSRKIVRVARSQGAWPTAVEIARRLAGGPGVGLRIGSSTVDAYHTILSERRGYCADYTQVYNGFAYAAGVAVREWGMTFDDFGSDGHAFNEIFEPRWNKWVFIDSYYSFFVEDRESGIPLSVLELRGELESADPEARLRVVPIDPTRFTFRTSEDALQYYRRGADQLFLVFGNDVFTYDQRPIVVALGSLSPPLAQLAAIALGIYPELVVVPSETNVQIARDLALKRAVLVGSASALLVLGLALAIQVAIHLRAGSR